MEAMKPISFTKITRRKYLAVRARIYAQADTTSICGDTGTAAGFGYSAQWNYSEPDQTLSIQCTNKPFWVPESLVTAKIQALVESVEL